MPQPSILKGGSHSDLRGILTFNNNFDALPVKRIYTIENFDMDFLRGWQGHKIEQRWFFAAKGSFEISVIKVDDWANPTKDLKKEKFTLSSDSLDVLHVPGGYITLIRMLSPDAKLIAMSDYLIGEIEDEFRFNVSHFIYRK